MENIIKTFVNEEFGTVRTLMKNGQPYTMDAERQTFHL